MEAVHKTPSPQTFRLPITEDDLRKQARLLQALADSKRLMILHFLVRYELGINVSELTEHLGIKQSSVSHHLRILRDARIIDCRTAGLYSYYYVKPEMLHIAQAALASVTPRAEMLSAAG